MTSDTWLLHMCDMTFPRTKSSTNVLYPNHPRTTWHLSHDSFTCVTWSFMILHITPSHVWHDSFTCLTWLLHMCDMTPSHVWHDSFTCVTWLLHMCNMTPSRVWHDICSPAPNHHHPLTTWQLSPLPARPVKKTSRHIYERVISHIQMSHVTHMIESCPTYERVMSHILIGHILDLFQHGLWKMSHVTYLNAYEWVTSHVWIRHVTNANESRSMYE